jgi:hypothetical protein
VLCACSSFAGAQIGSEASGTRARPCRHLANADIRRRSPTRRRRRPVGVQLAAGGRWRLQILARARGQLGSASIVPASNGGGGELQRTHTRPL